MRRLVVIAVTIVAAGALAQAQRVAPPRATEPLLLMDLGAPTGQAGWDGLEHGPGLLPGDQPGMQVTFPKWQVGMGEWPLMSLLYDNGAGYATSDWSHYGLLAYDVWVEGSKDQDLALELRNLSSGKDFGQHMLMVAGRVNHMEINLAEVGQQLDLTNVDRIAFWTTRPSETYRVVIGNIRLLPGEKTPQVELQLSYPNYRGMVLPQVGRATVVAALNTSEYALDPAELTLIMTCRGGGQEIITRRAMRAGSVRASVPTARFPAGPLTLLAAVIGTDGEALGSQSWDLRKLTVAEAADLPVYLDEDNNAIVGGEPFFPLGFYAGGDLTQTREMMGGPFNCVLDYSTNRKSRAEMTEYLDILAANDMKLIYCLNDVYPSATYLADRDWEGIKGNGPITDAVVAAYRHHPALLAWYLNDERPRSMVPEFQAFYDQVKQGDPGHPCLIVLYSMPDLPYFAGTTDVMGVDPYPVPGNPLAMVANYTDCAVASVGGRKPVWPVLQAFGWYQHDPQNEDRARIPNEQDLQTGRAPTYEESRCMAYLALTHGAKGLLYWCYYDMRVLPQYEEMWAGLKRIGQEVKTLAPVLLSPDDYGQATVSPASADLHTLVKRQGGRLVLIAVNSSREERRVTLNVRRPTTTSATVMFEDRTISCSNGTLSDTFKPLEAHVYDLGPAR